MEKLIKNIEHAQPVVLAQQVAYEPGGIADVELSGRSGVELRLRALDAGAEIGTHSGPGDALACILEGEALITVDGAAHRMTAGDAIVFPDGFPHSVRAVTPFKMLLTVIKQLP